MAVPGRRTSNAPGSLAAWQDEIFSKVEPGRSRIPTTRPAESGVNQDVRAIKTS